MKKDLPNRPGRFIALLGLFVVAATLGWSGEKRVWVQYQSGAKGPVMAALAQAGGRVHYEFDNLEAVAVTLPEQALNGIGRNPLVTLVEEDPVRVMAAETLPYGVPMVQSPLPVGEGATGAGITVGVIDSGVHREHADLPYNKLSGYPDLGANNEQTWYRDLNSHGTHVVGTIAAVGGNNQGVVGVAPGVDGIYMVKVFGDTGNWVYSSTLLAAVQNAVNSGHADIVSMSLGGGLKSRTEENGLKSIYNDGVLLVAAAGNGGNTTTSYPAGYASVMSVAAVAENGTLASFSQRNSTVEISAPGVAVLSTTSYSDVTTLTVGGTGYPSRHVELSARGTATGGLVYGGLGDVQNPGAWNSKVVLVDRGSISFYDKVRNVQLSGGVACIIANNEPGDLNATLGTGNTSAIPAVSITQAHGATLKGLTGQSTTVASSFTQPASGYDYFDGTSMATPHVSGVAALIWSKYPQASNVQVRQALTSTAQDLGAPGRDNSFGYGLVQAAAALAALDSLFNGGGEDATPPVISNVSTATSKGKPGAQGSFTVSFTTNEPATSVVNIPELGDKTTSLGTSHTVTFQGVKGATYNGTIMAKDAATNTSAPVGFTRNN